jgi:hypothetical protein
VEEVELKTSRYDSHRVHAGWLGTSRVFLAFSAWTRIPTLFIVPTDEPRQHHQVSLSCTTALKLSPTTAVRFTFYTTCFKRLCSARPVTLETFLKHPNDLNYYRTRTRTYFCIWIWLCCISYFGLDTSMLLTRHCCQTSISITTFLWAFFSRFFTDLAISFNFWKYINIYQ